MFKKKFCAERLTPPGGAAATSQAPLKGVKSGFEPDEPVDCTPIPVSEFDAMSDVAEWDKGLKWRLVARPGGAFIKPDDWYRLYAAVNQAKLGDNSVERPMWADHGGIDFGGRACWDAWSELKGMSRDAAIAKFCRVFAEAHTEKRYASNFHGNAKGPSKLFG